MPDNHALTVQTTSVVNVPDELLQDMSTNKEDCLRELLYDLAQVYDIETDDWRAPGTLIALEKTDTAVADVNDLAIRVFQHFKQGQEFPELPKGWYWVDKDVVLLACHRHLENTLTFNGGFYDLAAELDFRAGGFGDSGMANELVQILSGQSEF